MIYLSASSINLYQECPRCFWLKIKEKINRPSGPTSTLPNGMDYTLKNYFDSWRQKNKLPPELKSLLPGKLLPDQDKISWLRSRSLAAINQELGIKIGGMLDDALILEDQSIVPLDIKTRGFPLKEVHSAYALQMSVYTYLLQKNRLKTRNLAYLAFWYLDHKNMDLNQPLRFNIAVEEIKTEPEKIDKILNKIKQILDDQIPLASPDCQFCQYRQLEI
ncbi:MAG: PD-(D/E)XK nuclease family protein [Patescibacteria group bacterium]